MVNFLHNTYNNCTFVTSMGSSNEMKKKEHTPGYVILLYSNNENILGIRATKWIINALVDVDESYHLNYE